MGTIEDAHNAISAQELVWVHKTLVYGTHQDVPGVLQVSVGLAATWGKAAIVTPGAEYPRVQQLHITADEARELIKLGATDLTDDFESREIERIVADRKKRGK